jgi:predicted DNA-binding helix-hairpin-helix protein
LGDAALPAEKTLQNPADVLTREHRLYQVDFLMRKYGFKDNELLFDSAGRLSLTEDPKETWAKMHPEFFPLDVNRADKLELLRVPGLGHITVNRILKHRRSVKLHRITDIGKANKLLDKANKYLKF